GGDLQTLRNQLLVQQNSEIEQNRDHIEKKNLLLENQKTEIVRQRDQSNQLLLNILPEEVAKELKENGKAKPQYYDMCTVLFTDFKGFTGIAEALSPTQLVQELDACFLRFDEIISQYNLEKIKTIGDAYMCAGGIPVSNKTNPVDAVKAGLAMQEFMDEFNREKRQQGQPIWELRVGVHTGPLIAGVIGKHKFAYDVWGDTVNLAARMESSGEVGKVNISGSTHDLVKTHFNCTYRGKIQAKNKGEMDMYFVRKRASLFQGIQNMVTHPVQAAS
ncbi:MAG: adenylate/guanylate cyclase domain-containing protein, partial [Bacteroidota bacterium]